MDAKEFNELKKIHKYDINAANILLLYCLKIITKRVLYRNGPNDLESIAHSILEKFISKLPDRYIFSPVAYLHKCTDNYLSTLKRKKKREIALTCDISYEQRFDELEKFETMGRLEKHLDKLDVALIYGHCVEHIPEKELAKENNISDAAARQRISRAKKKLKKILSQNVTHHGE